MPKQTHLDLKSILILYVVLLVQISSSTVYAIDSCQSLFKNQLQTKIESQNGRWALVTETASQGTLEKFKLFLIKINHLTKKIYKPKLEITIVPRGQVALYDPTTDKIKIAEEYLKNSETEQAHPRDTQTAFAHEYGHAVIENVMRRLPLWNELDKQWNESQLPDANLLRAQSIMTAYREVFADLVAVMAVKDLNAVADTLRYNNDSPKERRLLENPRRFEGHMGEARRELWKSDNHREKDERFDPYLFFAPLRLELGEILPDVLRDSVKSEKFIAHVASLLRHDFQNRFTDLQSFVEIDPDLINFEITDKILESINH